MAVDVKVSWLQFDTSATDVKVSWLQFDTSAATVDVKVSWLQFDIAAVVGGLLPWIRRRRR